METGAVMPIPTPERDTHKLLQKPRFSGTQNNNRGFINANFALGRLLTMISLHSQLREWGTLRHAEQPSGFCLSQTSLHTDYTGSLGSKGPRWFSGCFFHDWFVFVALNYIAHATLSSDKSPLIQQDLQFLCSGTFIYEYLNSRVFKSLSSILSIGCSQYWVIEAFSQTLPNASTGPTSSSAPKLRACLAFNMTVHTVPKSRNSTPLFCSFLPRGTWHARTFFFPVLSAVMNL